MLVNFILISVLYLLEHIDRPERPQCVIRPCRLRGCRHFPGQQSAHLGLAGAWPIFEVCQSNSKRESGEHLPRLTQI